MAYADDVDFISMKEHRDVDEIQEVLKPHHLDVNTDKTEYSVLQRKEKVEDEKSWRTTKKVGSLIGDAEDVTRRKSLSTVALNKLNNIWIRKDKIKQSTRIKLYNSLTKSILTYNCGIWGLTKSQEEALDAHHRRQLRKVIGVRYPTKIRNSKLYEICQTVPMSHTLLQTRWTLFGHILRRDESIPARKAMEFYFTRLGKNFRGKARTTLPNTLANDLDILNAHTQNPHLKDHNYSKRITPALRTLEDLRHLRSLAENRNQWKILISSILEARQAGAAFVDPATAS